MDATVEFGWLVTYELGSSAIGRTSGKSFFSANEPSSFAKRVGASDVALYHPIRLSPTNSFHRSMRSGMQDFTGEFVKEKNFPYFLNVPSFGLVAVGVQVSLYLPNVVILRLTIHTPCSFDKESIFDQRRLSNHPVLLEVCDTASRLVAKSLLKDESAIKRTGYNSLLHITTSQTHEEFESQYSVKLSGILIGTALTGENNIIDMRVRKKNFEHNIKSEGGNLVLADKMGVLVYILDGWDDDKLVNEQIKRRHDLYELALSLRALYTHRRGGKENDDLGWFLLVCCSDPLIQKYQHTFNISMSNSFFWKTLKDAFALDVAYDEAIGHRLEDFKRNKVIIYQMQLHKYSEDAFWIDYIHRAGLMEMASAHRSASQTFYLLGDITVGDDYSNSINTAGAIGSGSTSVNANVMANSQRSGDGDAAKLSSELTILIEALRKEAKSPDQEVALSNVCNALSAHEQGKEGHSNAYLKTGGKWVLGVAEKIGVSFAAATIRSAIGG